ncbi:MAG: PEP-CTERM sorting domain-containing protein [Planctomycetota bacterium]
MNLKLFGMFSGAMLGTACMAPSINAETIVDFDGNTAYTGSFNSLGSLGGSSFGTAFDDTNPQVSGATGTSSTWYGGMVHTNGNGGAYNYQASNIGTSSGIHHRLNGAGSGTATALAYWQVADFLNGGVPVVLDTDSEFRIGLDSLNSNTHTLIVGWVIETTSGFFISDFAGFLNAGGNGTFTDDDLSDNVWRDYDPATSLSAVGSIAAPDLGDVIGVGYRLNTSTDSGTLNFRSRVGEFEVIANPIPEPGSLLLAGAGGLMLLVRRRRG